MGHWHSQCPTGSWLHTETKDSPNGQEMAFLRINSCHTPILVGSQELAVQKLVPNPTSVGSS
jgi:hypothetical protein